MDAREAIAEVISQMTDFFREKRLSRDEHVQGWRHDTVVLSQAEIAKNVASELLSKLGDKGCRVLELPPVEVDEYGNQTVRIPITGQGWAYGEVRVSDKGDRLNIVDVPARLPIEDAPVLASALMAAYGICRPTRQ